MKSCSRRGNDVAEWFGLVQIHSLLLLQHQEAVELCSRLLLVVVLAHLQQTDGGLSGLGHRPLKKEKTRFEHMFLIGGG